MKIVDVSLDTEQVYIAPLGDIQYGNEAFAGKHFSRAMERLVNYNAHVPVHVVGTGDYVDFMSPSNRDKYKASGLYTTSQRTVEYSAARLLVEDLRSQMPDELTYDGIVHGHHWFHYNYQDYEYYKVPKDLFVADELPRNTDHHLALLLGSEIALSTMLVRYHFPDGRTFKALVWHGDGGSGVYNTNGLNKLIKRALGWGDINAVFMGHTHVLASTAVTRLNIDEENNIAANNIVVVNAGSFLKGYIENSVTYVEQRGLNALALGHAIVQVSPGVGDDMFEVGVNLRW